VADFMVVREGLEKGSFKVSSAELTMIPKTTVGLNESDARKTLRLLDALEDNDDVQEVYANFDIPDEVMEAIAG
jgi:transcriptional/translational regulatory protein YebC/TACO1